MENRLQVCYIHMKAKEPCCFCDDWFKMWEAILKRLGGFQVTSWRSCDENNIFHSVAFFNSSKMLFILLLLSLSLIIFWNSQKEESSLNRRLTLLEIAF